MLRSFTKSRQYTATSSRTHSTTSPQQRRIASRAHHSFQKIKFDWRNTPLSAGKLSHRTILDNSTRYDMFQQMADCVANRNLPIYVPPCSNEFILLQQARHCLSIRLLEDGNWLIGVLMSADTPSPVGENMYFLPCKVSHMDMLLMRTNLIRHIVATCSPRKDILAPATHVQVAPSVASTLRDDLLWDLAACLSVVSYASAFTVIIYIASVLLSDAMFWLAVTVILFMIILSP